MENDVQEFLASLIETTPEYELSQLDQKVLTRSKEEYLLGKILSKKFRKKSVSNETREDITSKVRMSVEQELPIHFTIPFGGYKHFSNPSHPYPDWAEVFHFAHMREYAAAIAKVHVPGVLFDYISEDIIVPYMNNYPKEAFDQYMGSFEKLIGWFNDHSRENVQFQCWRVGERVIGKKLIADVMEVIPERRKEFDMLPLEQQTLEVHRSKRNVNWSGEEDLSNLNEGERLERMIESHLLEFAYYDTEARDEYIGDYLWGGNHINMLFSFGFTHDNPDGLLTIGTTSSSIVDFWIGRGVLEKRNDEFVPRVLSIKQYESIKSGIEEVSVNSTLPGRNYRTIKIYHG